MSRHSDMNTCNTLHETAARDQHARIQCTCRCSQQQVLAYVTLAVVSFLRAAELLTLLELSLGTDGARADRDLAADTAAEAHVQRVTALAVPELRAVALVVVCTGGGEARVT